MHERAARRNADPNEIVCILQGERTPAASISTGGFAMLLAYLPVLIFEAFLEMLNEPAARPAAHSGYDDREGSRRDRS
jgi:hypothetical protein